ncbi:MAG TPA: VOC family protein [Polyangiaceae bacterium]|nr:VOC family protein [Polyangiaceae bacterium]
MVHHIAFRSGDVARLERFYGETLGLRVLRRDDARGSVWLDAGGTLVMLEKAGAGEPPVPPGSLDLVAFAADDKEVWRARLQKAAVRVEAETDHTLYFRDPDGRRVAVSTYVRAPGA